MAENEMVRQHHQLNGDEFEQTVGDSEGQEEREAWHAGVCGIAKNQTQLCE